MMKSAAIFHSFVLSSYWRVLAVLILVSPSSQSCTLCEKKSERGSPSTFCVFSWVSSLKPQHKCPAWYHDRPHCPPPGKSAFTLFLSRSYNTCPPPHYFPLMLLLAGAFGRKKVQEEQEAEDNSSGSEKTTAATATLSFQHLSPAECGSRSAPSVRTWEREHPQPQRFASSSQT